MKTIFSPQFKRRRNLQALTLIELLAVLVILALVAGIAVPQVISMLRGGKTKAAESEISGIEQALQGFYLDCGFYPQSEPGLKVLFQAPTVGRQCKNYRNGGYLKLKGEKISAGGIPLDPFDNEYQYVYPGQKNPDSFDLYSKGADGEAGTEDDVKNW